MMDKPFVLPIQTPLGKYFYEVNRNEVVKVNDDLFMYINQILTTPKPELVSAPTSTKEQYEELEECGYLSTNHVTKIVHPAVGLLKPLLSRGLTRMTLQVTQQCNLRCKYCIYSENSNLSQRSHSNNYMTWETAKRAVDFYYAHSIDTQKPHIGFYGGEPFLAFPLIEQVVLYAEKLFEGKDISFAATTNATILTDEMLDFISKHNFGLTFSLDGPKEIQDRNRVFRNGGGTYDLVMKNFNKIYQQEPAVIENSGINMVVTPDHQYEQILELFKTPVLEPVSLRSAYVEKDFDVLQPSEDYLAKYNYDGFVALAAYLRGDKVTNSNKLMKEMIDTFGSESAKFQRTEMPFVGAPSGPCIPGKLRLFINCFGEFYPCEKVNEKPSMKIGSLDDGFDFDAITRILNVSQLLPEKCKSCWAFSLCTICAERVDDGSGLSIKRLSDSCEGSRKLAFHRILQKILLFEHNAHMREISKWEVSN